MDDKTPNNATNPQAGEDCDCGNHGDDDTSDKYQLRICPTERWADGLINYLKKEFEKDKSE